jgi:hypothetical protein
MSANELSRVPRLQQEGALGWRDIPLDGLNCYQRSIEAILRSVGYTRDQVLFELGGAITDTMPSDGSPWFALRSSSARWAMTGPEADLWHVVEARLRAGEPILVWPDWYYWPGSRFHARRHVYDHAVLLTELTGDRVQFLDIDTDPGNEYVDSVAIDDETRQAFKRLLEVRPGAPGQPPTPAEVRGMVASSVPPLARWVQGIRRLVEQWRLNPRPRLAYAAEWWIFSDLLPQVFLFTRICAAYGERDLERAGEAAGRQAKKAGLFLIALNEYRWAAPYELCEEDLVTLGDRLQEMTYVALESAQLDVLPGRDPEGECLWRRLDGLLRWHSGHGIND